MNDLSDEIVNENIMMPRARNCIHRCNVKAHTVPHIMHNIIRIQKHLDFSTQFIMLSIYCLLVIIMDLSRTHTHSMHNINKPTQSA